jgi:hypothetical protein
MANLYYHPSNATEGAQFEGSWCAHCIHEKSDYWEDEFGNDVEGHCDILTRAAVYPVEQWVYRDGKPACLAFQQDPARQARCLATKEMTF